MISGNDIAKQCQAAGCICNLALGDSRAGVAVTKSAGPYLIAALDNLTTELAVRCCCFSYIWLSKLQINYLIQTMHLLKEQAASKLNKTVIKLIDNIEYDKK